MKRNNKTQLSLIIGVCLLLTGLAAQASDKLPQGRWVVKQVSIEITTNGRAATTTHSATAKVTNHIPCPQELEISEKSVVLRYSDGCEDDAGYTLEGDQLTIHVVAGKQTYKCDVNDDTLTLTATYHYVNNDLKAKKSEQISEKRVIVFKNDKTEK